MILVSGPSEADRTDATARLCSFLWSSPGAGARTSGTPRRTPYFGVDAEPHASARLNYTRGVLIFHFVWDGIEQR